MNYLLTLLLEYSRQGRIVDRDFIQKTVKLLVNKLELNDFIHFISFSSLSGYDTNQDEIGIPMGYNFYTKEIIFDEENIAMLYQDLLEIYREKNYSLLEQRVASNAILLHAILHEIEHANQHKKSLTESDNFENLLLGVCLYAKNEFLKLDNLTQQLIMNSSIVIDSEFHNKKVLDDKILKQYGSASPIERLANIHSIKQLRQILRRAEKSIPNVMNMTKEVLFKYYLRFYHPEGTGPTELFLQDYQELSIPGAEVLFDERFYLSMQEAYESGLSKRLTLGLNVTPEEYRKNSIYLEK